MNMGGEHGMPEGQEEREHIPILMIPVSSLPRQQSWAQLLINPSPLPPQPPHLPPPGHKSQ